TLTITIFAILIYSMAAIQEFFLASYDQFKFLFKEFSFLFVLDFINFFIYTIVVFFFLYIIHFFLKRRRDEIALYKLLGLNRMNILQIFFIENCLIIIIAFFLSIILGVFFSRFALMILSSFMNLAIKSFP